MSALNMLCEYASDSDNDDDSNDTNSKSSRQRLPVPKSILTWQGVEHHQEVISDPSKYEGRIRTFEHERGNWATITYIKYDPSSTMYSWMNKLHQRLKSKVNIDSFTLHEDFHISLTRTIIIKYHWIDSFVESMKKLCGNVHKFVIKLSDMKVYCNDTETRTFLGLSCFDEGGSLEHLTNQLNQLLNEYKLPPFYKDASYHISIIWCLGNKRKQLEEGLKDLTITLAELLDENFDERQILVSKIHCKIGNRNYMFELRD